MDAVLLLGIGLGLRHGTDPDPLAAIGVGPWTLILTGTLNLGRMLVDVQAHLPADPHAFRTKACVISEQVYAAQSVIGS